MELNTAVNLPADTSINEFAAEISDEIMTNYEKPLLKRITEHEFPYSSHGERLEIFNLALKHARGESADVMDIIHYERRKSLIEEQTRNYLKENNFIIIDGFVNFRLEEYKNELKNLCLDAAEELYALREYDEFMNMLRFFVSVQAPKEPLVHLIKTEGMIRIHNKRLKDITKVYCENSLFDEEGFSQEDIILSALITIAPRKIIIHDSQDKERIYNTISNVFSQVEFIE
ncbi:MAG: hypothetical protein E7406_00370 [Ruminococcaceae bacterium]|nr:hypothetical protein [Oscillospiraceae bacterium]